MTLAEYEAWLKQLAERMEYVIPAPPALEKPSKKKARLVKKRFSNQRKQQ